MLLLGLTFSSRYVLDSLISFKILHDWSRWEDITFHLSFWCTMSCFSLTHKWNSLESILFHQNCWKMLECTRFWIHGNHSNLREGLTFFLSMERSSWFLKNLDLNCQKWVSFKIKSVMQLLFIKLIEGWYFKIYCR